MPRLPHGLFLGQDLRLSSGRLLRTPQGPPARPEGNPGSGSSPVSRLRPRSDSTVAPAAGGGRGGGGDRARRRLFLSLARSFSGGKIRSVGEGSQNHLLDCGGRVAA